MQTYNPQNTTIMRRIIGGVCLLVVMLMGALDMSAQSRKLRPEYLQQKQTPHAIGVNVGMCPIGYDFDTWTSSAIITDTYSSIVTPLIGVRYMYTLSPTISLGGALHYMGKVTSGAKDHFMSVAVECRFTYVRQNLVKIYGSIGLGTTYDFYSKGRRVDNEFSFNISPIGIRVGRQVGGYLELSFGCRGLVAMGVDFITSNILE